MDQAQRPLPRAAGARLYQAVSGMSAAGWLGAGGELEGSLARAAALLCALRGAASLPQYLQMLAPGGGGGGPCTRVWTAGTIAYRCHTCGLSPSAAICVDCFRASEHEGHDFVMYTSDAGGCCDCGDMSSWRTEGCCRQHRPVGEGRGAAPAPALPAADEAVASGVVGCCLARLQLALEGCLRPEGSPAPAGAPSPAQEHSAALRLMGWLGQLGQQPALRQVVCDQLMQPATAAAAAAAGSLAATEQLPAEAASVARMLQQQREQLLQRLEETLPTPDGRPGRPLPQLGPAPQPLLYWLLSALLPLDGSLVEELSTLLILLLYSMPFKEHFGRLLLAFYPILGALGKRHAVTKALDRVTVQVFHLEETCLALVQHDRLLEVLLDGMLGVLRRAVGADGRLDGDSAEVAGRHYLRIGADLHMCLSHPSVVLQLMSPAAGPRAAALFLPRFLEAFRLVQGATPFRRQLGEHVLYETTAYLNTVQLEVHLMHMLKQGALHTLLKAAEQGTVPPEAAALALSYAVSCCLEAVEVAAGPLQAAQEPPAYWSGMMSGQSQMSAHIPLERLAAAFLGGLLHLASTSAAPQPYLAVVRTVLGRDAASPEGVRAAWRRRWEMCGLAAERVLSWMSQIRQRLWVRNGQQLLRLEAFYSSPYWSDHGLDCDLLAVQAWLASTPDVGSALGFFVYDSGAAVVLRCSGEADAAAAAAVLQDPRRPPEMLRLCADWLRLLVQVLRERACWHPTYSPLALRRALVHTLAAGPRRHSEVGDELPYELSHSPHFDQALAEVADYRPPTAASTGEYSLRSECWREFDPFYLHYTPRQLQSALHTAQEGSVWQPQWQLQLGIPALPPPMASLQRVTNHVLRLVWTALLAACVNSGGGGGGGAAEDCALAAVSLLSLALQCKAVGLAALIRGSERGGAESSAAAAAAADPLLPAAWATPAGFLQKCEEHLAGSSRQQVGIIYLLQVLAGSEPWVLDGSRQEGSWELKACATAAAAEAQQLLQAARQNLGAQQAAEAGTAGQAADAAGEAAPSRAPVPEAADAADVDASEQQEQSLRKQPGKQRQQQMLARMRAQQAKAAAALLDEETECEPQQPAAAAQAEPAEPMDVDAAGSQAPAAAAAADRRLPAHHPAAWEAHRAECVLCHTGSETAPLGLVAQLQVTVLPVLASADPAAPLTPEHPGQPAGSIFAAATDSSAASEEAGGAAVFPAGGAGPRLSVFDRQPSMHLLCCGHIMHASCLERYRSSWRQRIASGQFVEGFQLLESSASAGEYLCPICRRLGNCLLPLAVPLTTDGGFLQPAAAQQQQAQPPPSAQQAVQQVEQLLHGEASWATAPATSSQALQQQWQQAQAGASSGSAESPPSAQLQPEAVQLLPRLGCHAAGAAALCEFARLAGSKWMLQQQWLLEWLQHKASEQEDGAALWGIPVAVAAEEAATEPAGPPSLQTALQQLLQQAGGEGGPAATEEAMDAFAQAAAAMVVLVGPEDEQLAEDGSSEEEQEEVEAEGLPGGEVEAVFEQLQQQVEEAAEEAAAVQLIARLQAPTYPPSHTPAQAAALAAGPLASALSQHTRRFWAAAAAGSMLCSLLGSGIGQWEVAHREPGCNPSPEVDAAHWRALQSLAQLALAAGAAPPDHSVAVSVLQQVAAGSLPQLSERDGTDLSADASAALLPGLIQLQVPPAPGRYCCSQDPFALLLALAVALVSRPSQLGEVGLSCSAHTDPTAVLEAVVAAVYPVAAGQAVALATGTAHSAADAAAAMAASRPLAQALHGAVSSQLLPWLRRAALLRDLLRGRTAPAAPASASGSAADEAMELLQQLHLPSLTSALQSPAAGCLAVARGSSCPARGGLELSILAGQQWEVSSLPLPAAPKLLQLPTSYQGWYLSLGNKTCSVCGHLPSEPALCLRCGEVLCCSSRRCQGPTRQGTCFAHSLACGSGTCCFLMAKMTRLLVIRKNRATFLTSPYVDNHGEEDVRLQRGKPLSLHADRLRHLVQLWRGAAFDFDSHVLHTAKFASVL